MLLCSGEFKDTLEFKENNEQIVSFLKENVNAIGYANWIDKPNLDKKIKGISITNIPPSKENIINDTYPYSYYISFLINQQKNSVLENEFLKFVLLKEGQAINVMRGKVYECNG